MGLTPDPHLGRHLRNNVSFPRSEKSTALRVSKVHSLFIGMTKEELEATYPISWKKKINPLWWFGNYNDPVDRVNQDGTEVRPTFYPGKPHWFRAMMWGLRNPLHNFCFFVIGLEDRTYLINDGQIWPKKDRKWNVRLPFISYRGKKWEFYFGWRKGQTFGINFTKSNTPAI